MKRLVIGIGIALVLLVLTVTLFYKRNTPTLAQPLAKTRLLTLVNAERAKHGVPPLVEDARLDQSAQYKADDEVSRSYFSHTDPTTSKLNGIDKIRELVSCNNAGENLGNGFTDVESIVKAWTNSPEHEAIMTKSEYTITGFGISGDKVVEHFCQAN